MARGNSSVSYLNCQMGDHIRPEGWDNWRNPDNEKTARYAEYHSRTLDIKLPHGKIVAGKLIDVSRRVPWSRQLTPAEAAQYTLSSILGGADHWSPTFSKRLRKE